MNRALVIAVVAICHLGATPAGAAQATSARLCARPEVLALARERLGGREAHFELIDDSVSEIATDRSDVVLCAVSVRVLAYDAGTYRARPADLLEPRYFEVRRLPGGFAVDFSGR